MPVQTCDAYPGSKLSKLSNEETESDCSCVADPGAHSAKKAFSCPPDMVLKFDDVADQSTGIVVPQYHCTKQQTETIKTSQPLQCQPGWMAETVDGKGICTITTTKCDPNEVIVYENTEFGIMSAPKDCHCKKSIVVECVDEATYNPDTLSCEWEIDVTSTVITRPLNNYVMTTDGALEHLTVTESLALVSPTHIFVRSCFFVVLLCLTTPPPCFS